MKMLFTKPIYRNLYHIGIFLISLSFAAFMIASIIPVKVKHNAVLTKSRRCAEVGRDILEDQGTAVEAAIAMLACECVASPDLTGLGGGFVAMIHNHKTEQVDTLIATEWSHVSFLPKYPEPIDLVAVPAMLTGLIELHKKYNKTMEWKALFHGANELAKEYAKDNRELLKRFPEHHDLILSKELQVTIEAIMTNGVDEYFRGDVGKKFIEDIGSQGSSMKKEDLTDYSVRWEEPYATTFQDKKLYTTPSPTAGIMSITLVKLLTNYLQKHTYGFYKHNFAAYTFPFMEMLELVLSHWSFLGDAAIEGESKKLYTFMQEPRFIYKVMKSVFGYRAPAELFDRYDGESVPLIYLNNILHDCLENATDLKFVFNQYQYNYRVEVCDFIEFKEQSSMDIIVVKNNHDSIIISTSLTSRFGSKIVSKQTGIIMNDHLSLFNSFKYNKLPNAIAMKKRPLNWFTPMMVVPEEHGRPEMILSAASAGVVNIEATVKFIFNYYILKRFEEHPTIKHFVNQMRSFFRILEITKFSTESEEDFTVPTMVFENEQTRKEYFRFLHDKNFLYTPKINATVNYTANFAVMSVASIGGIPDPDIYIDARGNGATEWFL